MAPSRLPTPLALEVATSRRATSTKEPAKAHSHYCGRECEWRKGQIADELSLTLGLLVDARTVGKYLKQTGPPRPPRNQRWATFQVVYVFIAIDIGSRRILHVNVTDHPTAEWTRQQFRSFVDRESSRR